MINEDENKYVIPLSPAKEKHKFWNNIESDRFLIYEISNKKPLSKNAVFKENPDGTVKQIFSVIDLKKMLPIKEGLYTRVDLTTNPQDSVETRNYKNLMNKEFAFCLKILPIIIQKANELYDKQISTGKILKFCCDFRLLEERSREYSAK